MTERETETKMIKTEIKAKDAKVLPKSDWAACDIRGVEGSHVLTHPVTGESVLVISVEELKTRMRVWVASVDRYDEFGAEDGHWNLPTEELRAQAEERLVIFNNVPVSFQ